MDASAFGGSLNCSICLDIFKEPLVLTNCGHSVCCKCVQKLIEASPTRRSVFCPECRTVSEVPPGGFKKNYRLADSLEQPRHSTVSADTAKFVGMWRFVISENYDEYMNEIGVSIMTRKELGLDDVESVGIEVNGEHWKTTYTSSSRTSSFEFVLDKEIKVTSHSGSAMMKYTFHFIGGKLIREVAKIDSKERSSWAEWHVEDGMLVVTMETETGVKAKRIYERV